MAKIDTVTFPSSSGKKHTFTAYTTDTVFPQVGAVYIFTKQVNNSYTRLYIGQTDNLDERISNHEEWPCVRQHGVNSICVLEKSGAFSRLQIEQDLLGLGNTPCNEK